MTTRLRNTPLHRLKHAPVRELTDDELVKAHRRRWVDDALYAAECERRFKLLVGSERLQVEPRGMTVTNRAEEVY